MVLELPLLRSDASDHRWGGILYRSPVHNEITVAEEFHLSTLTSDASINVKEAIG
ncbi:hypothetical protein HDU78_010497, partial [Chytriomyces hyalinus]